ncbi:LLM class flavin-dependent oxidoreductase [Cardiobacteriaceae bacterium TAE3-ERU3]|nr:LLM class flavin-dependent oxidoreductase [Cardiobacteriaceae bacterium TAE3-ERU3]
MNIGFSLSPTWLTPQHDPYLHYDIALYIDVAQRAEAAGIDFIFKPDSLYLSPDSHSHAPKHGSLDPTLLLAAIATHTKRITLITTISTTFVPPYLIARQVQTLQWLSDGRAGWNIVTSLDGAALFGLDAMPDSQSRYARAHEVTALVKALWASHDEDGLHTVEHPDCCGVLNVPMHPHGQAKLFQAGASDDGRDFAAATADAIFAATPNLDSALNLKHDLQQRATAQGRDADAVRVLPGIYLFLGETRDAAQALYEQANSHISREQRLCALNTLLGADFSHCTDDTRLTEKDLPPATTTTRSRTHTNLLRRLICRESPTLGELLIHPEVIHSAHWVIVGTAADACAEIRRWQDAGAIDGFIALPGGGDDSLQRFFDQLMPLLRDTNRRQS